MKIQRLIFNGIDCSAGRSYIHYGWRKERAIHIKEYYWCAACGYIPKRGTNDVHHIIPRHLAPWLADQLFNLITLCEIRRCHIEVGHFGNFRRYWNPEIVRLLGDTGKQLMQARLYMVENYVEMEKKWKEQQALVA